MVCLPGLSIACFLEAYWQLQLGLVVHCARYPAKPLVVSKAYTTLGVEFALPPRGYAWVSNRLFMGRGDGGKACKERPLALESGRERN